jgi:hypothetical protein
LSVEGSLPVQVVRLSHEPAEVCDDPANRKLALPFQGRILQTHCLRALRAIPFSVFLFDFPFILSRSASHLSAEGGFLRKLANTNEEIQGLPFSLISLPNLLVSLMTCSSALPARSLAVASLLRIMFQIPPTVVGWYWKLTRS